MKLSVNAFALVCLFIAAVLACLHYLSFEAVAQQSIQPEWMLMYAFFAITYWLSYRWVTKSMDQRPQQFVNTFMLVTVGRMLLSLIFLIPMLLANKENGTGKVLAVYFVIGYFAFLVTEIIFLYKLSKSKS